MANKLYDQNGNSYVIGDGYNTDNNSPFHTCYKADAIDVVLSGEVYKAHLVDEQWYAVKVLKA